MSMSLKDTIAALDVNNDALWTADGQPRIEVLKEMTGLPVTRPMIMSEVGIVSRDTLRQQPAAVNMAFGGGLPTTGGWGKNAESVVVDKSNPDAEAIDTSSLYTPSNIEKHREDIDEDEVGQPPMRERVEMLRSQIKEAEELVDAKHTVLVEVTRDYDEARAHLATLNELLAATNAQSQDNQAAIRAMLQQSTRQAEAGYVAPINKAREGVRPNYIHSR